MSTSTPEPADTNDLQRWLFEFRQTVDRNINRIIGFVVLATIAVVAYQVITRSAAAKKAAEWSEYSSCHTADDYKKVAEKHPGTTVEYWSRLEAARLYIQSGVGQSTTNRVASDESLNSGKTQLETLLKMPGLSEEVREHALSQLAVCLEALCDGNTQPVVDAYEKLVKDFPESQYVPWAKNRIEILKKPSTGEFYAWFRKSKPAPVERPKPQDIKPGDAPNIKLDGLEPAASSGDKPSIPETPAGGETKPAEGSAQPFPSEAKPAEAPAANGAPAASEPAKSETPAEKPAEPAAPAAEKPAAPSAETPKP
mgnify:CR=1 FL=1